MVRRLLARGADKQVLHILEGLSAAQVASLLASIPRERRAAMSLLMEANPPLAAEVVRESRRAGDTELIDGLGADALAAAWPHLPADDAAALVMGLSPERRQSLMKALRPADAATLQSLLAYGEKTAGRLMHPSVFFLPSETVVADAVRHLRQASGGRAIFYLYLVDDRGRLEGLVPLRQLVTAAPETPLSSLMDVDVARVSTDTGQEELAHVIASRKLLAVPVVDSEERLVGEVTVDDAIDVVLEEAADDMYGLAGLDTGDSPYTPWRASARMRAPWLLLNLVTALVAAFVVSRFETTIARFAVLAVFMPVVAGMGGNAASQTLTVTIRGLAFGKVRWSNARRLIFKELAVGALNGVAFGALVSLVAVFSHGYLTLGFAIALAMIGNLLVAALAGVVVPLGFKAIGVDPAVASAVVVTTCTDVCGFFFFLSLGAWLLGRFGVT